MSSRTAYKTHLLKNKCFLRGLLLELAVVSSPPELFCLTTLKHSPLFWSESTYSLLPYLSLNSKIKIPSGKDQVCLYFFTRPGVFCLPCCADSNLKLPTELHWVLQCFMWALFIGPWGGGACPRDQRTTPGMVPLFLFICLTQDFSPAWNCQAG